MGIQYKAYCCKQGRREFKSQTNAECLNTSSFRQKSASSTCWEEGDHHRINDIQNIEKVTTYYNRTATPYDMSRRSVTTHSMPVHEFLPVLWKMLTNAQKRKKTALTSLSKIYISYTVLEKLADRVKLRQSTDAAHFQDNVQECQYSPISSTDEQQRWDHMRQPPRNLPSATDCTFTGWKSMLSARKQR